MERLLISFKTKWENESENIEKFLLSFGSTQIETIWFFGYSIEIQNEYCNYQYEYSSYFEVYPCSSYFYGLREAISKSTKYVWIDQILLSGKEFSAILRAAKHVKELYFRDCKILADEEHELGEMEGWQIEILTIGYIINVYTKYRDCDDSCMKIFMLIVGCPNLLRSLRRIRFGCGDKMKEKLFSKAKKILGTDYDMLMKSFEG